MNTLSMNYTTSTRLDYYQDERISRSTCYPTVHMTRTEGIRNGKVLLSPSFPLGSAHGGTEVVNLQARRMSEYEG
jgi:hypothetical protein